MENYLVMCRSITYAQRAQRLLERANIGAHMVKAPQAISAQGCSYGLKIAGRNALRALDILERAGIRRGEVYKIAADGVMREAEL